MCKSQYGECVWGVCKNVLKNKYMWWLPLPCILIVIVVACIFSPLATTLRGVGGLTIMSGQLGPEALQ